MNEGGSHRILHSGFLVKKICKITSSVSNYLIPGCIMNASHSSWLRHQAMFGGAKAPFASQPARLLTRKYRRRTFAQSTAVSALYSLTRAACIIGSNSCTARPLVCCQQLDCSSASCLLLPQLSFPVAPMLSSAQKLAFENSTLPRLRHPLCTLHLPSEMAQPQLSWLPSLLQVLHQLPTLLQCDPTLASGPRAEHCCPTSAGAGAGEHHQCYWPGADRIQ